MKILQVIPYFTPKRGGDVNVCYNLSKFLAQKGHEVTIITTDFEFDQVYAKSLENANLRIIPFHCLKNFQLFLFSPDIKNWISKNIKKFDVVHVHEFRTYQNIIIVKYANKFNIPVILQPHNDLPNSVEKKFLKSLFDVLSGNNIIKKVRKIIAVSQQEFEIARNLGIDASDITLIYNGLDIDLLDTENATNKDERINRTGQILLYFGRIHKSKGIDNIIYSFNNVIKKYPECNLLIAGSDSGYKKHLVEIVKNLNLDGKVTFYDYVDENQKRIFFKKSHILLHPVLFMGGVGLIPLEAILCKTPVIVTKECGEIIEKCGCGYIVKYGDIEELTATILRIFENYSDAKQKAIEGRKYILENFSWDVVVKEYEHVYQSVKG